MQAILKRATDLGVVTERQARYVWMQLSAAGYRLREPPELDVAVEEPRLLSAMVDVHTKRLRYSLEDLGRLLGLLDRELRELYFQTPAGLRIVGGRGTAGSRWSGLEG